MALVFIFGLIALGWPLRCYALTTTCDTVSAGYQCAPIVSQNWGQYSPYFTVSTTLTDVVPPFCNITFAQTLMRHGARYPTASKTTTYNSTIAQIQKNVKSYGNSSYAFLANYTYNLGADNLTAFGQQEMNNAGVKFYERYQALASTNTPFFRASSEYRVVISSINFTIGYHAAKAADPSAIRDPFPYPILEISEDAGANNSLNHGLCNAFENGTDNNIAGNAQTAYASVFVPSIQTRLNNNLPGANLSTSQVINMMDLCPFDTVSTANGTISPFCNLFTTGEFVQYSYYQSLGKWYGYANGNPLGSSQGVGFTNELIARMTDKPVMDATSTNRTLDANPAYFPIGPDYPLYADFSHDNDMTAIFAAMGLYNQTANLSNTTVQNPNETFGYSAAYTVPFGARAYFEKMQCAGYPEEFVRVLINDRVIPLQNCGADGFGRCTLNSWVNSLSFARNGGLWSQCFS